MSDSQAIGRGDKRQPESKGRLLREAQVLDNLQDLNFTHLFYFWRVARDGSIATACQRLELTQPTISAQLRKLEKSLGHRLFDRAGRNLVLTAVGKTVYEYADDIFDVGRELLGALRGLPGGRSQRLLVGIPNCLPKLIAYRLLLPVIQLPQQVQVICHERQPEELLADLARHRFDVILSDAPLSASSGVRGFNHPLGECGVAICGVDTFVNDYRPQFPDSLDGAPFLLPPPSTAVRRAIDRWFDEIERQPKLVGEFDDSALMKEFGSGGAGMFPIPEVVLPEVKRQYGVGLVGYIPTVRVRYFAITSERKLTHPAVHIIAQHAKQSLLLDSQENLDSFEAQPHQAI